MKIIIGDIFDIISDYDAVCITTNGNIKKDKKAVMGAGVAKVFRDKVENIDVKLANSLKVNGNTVQILDQYMGTKILSFPTKENWRDDSDLELIKKSILELNQIIIDNNFEKVLLPQPGCTNGNLDWNDVKKEIAPILSDKVTIISKGKVLECSSKGDKRFSAFYAKVEAFGYIKSIEEFYQLSKRFGEEVPKTIKDAKGKEPSHIVVNGKKLDKKYSKSWYELLWVKYLDNNPNLVQYAKTFDDFNDIFKSKKSIVCQADTIRDYVKKGRKHILNKHKEFIKLVK